MEKVNSMGAKELIIQPSHWIIPETPADFKSSAIPVCFSLTTFLVIVGTINKTEYKSRVGISSRGKIISLNVLLFSGGLGLSLLHFLL